MKKTFYAARGGKFLRRLVPCLVGGFLLCAVTPATACNEDEDIEPIPENVIDGEVNNHINLDSVEFTAAEKRIVATATQGLFDNKDILKIDLSQYEKEDWCYPLLGSHVISPFGGRRRHSGIDIKTKPNDEIHAVFDGVVRFSQPYYGYGNVIVIRHANGLETLYSHQSKNFVKAGDRVKAGDVIGLTGRTGRATTEHCHFEVRVNGKIVNPNMLLDTDSQSLKADLLGFNKHGKKVNVGTMDATLDMASNEVDEEEKTSKKKVAYRKKSTRKHVKRTYMAARSKKNKQTVAPAKGGLYIAKSKRTPSGVGVM